MTKLGLARDGRPRGELIRSGIRAAVVAVIRADGSCPAKEFLDEVKIAQLEMRIESFCAMGTLRTPEAFRRLDVDDRKPAIWEIKSDKGPGYRLYGVRLGQRFVATHGTPKRKGTRAVRIEVERARTIYEEWKGAG